MNDKFDHVDRLSELGLHIALVTHELTGPASLISGGLDNLSDCVASLRSHLDSEVPPGGTATAGAPVRHTLETADDLLAICNQGLEQLSRILFQIRAYARPLSSTTTTPIDLRSVLSAAATTGLAGHSVTPHVEWALCDELTSVGDPVGLECVFANLIRNAADALVGQPVPTIWVSATRTSDPLGVDTIDVCIRDNGPGVAVENQHAIFDAFFSTKATGVGLGLGLVIARDALKQMGGSIDLRSPDGSGAEFVVHLPAASPAQVVDTIAVGGSERANGYPTTRDRHNG